MAAAENGTQCVGPRASTTKCAQHCATAASVLDAEADDAASSTTERMRGEAEASWQAARLALPPKPPLISFPA